MFKNYFKIAIRNILRYKGFSFLNISGLTLGLSVFILMMLWIREEISYDKFFKNHQLATPPLYQTWQRISPPAFN